MMEYPQATLNADHHVFTVNYDRLTNFIYCGCGISANGKMPLEEHKYDELVACWDTGAKMTTVSSAILGKLGLKKTKEMYFNTISGTVKRNYYKVDVYLPGGLIIPGVEASEGEMSRADVLIGMDIIMMGDFAISNLDGKTTFTFRLPSEKVMDFYKERLN